MDRAALPPASRTCLVLLNVALVYVIFFHFYDLLNRSLLVRLGFGALNGVCTNLIGFWVIAYRNRAVIILRTGCLPAPAYPQKDPILGLDVFRENMNHLKGHTFLTKLQERMEMMKTGTFTIVALGRSTTVTMDPENLKTMQAKEFKKWSLGTRRKIAFQPLLGKGPYYSKYPTWNFEV